MTAVVNGGTAEEINHHLGNSPVESNNQVKISIPQQSSMASPTHHQNGHSNKREPSPSDDEDDMPLLARKAKLDQVKAEPVTPVKSKPNYAENSDEEDDLKMDVKQEQEQEDGELDDEDDVPLAVRVNKTKTSKHKREEESDEDDYKPEKKKKKKEHHKEKDHKHKSKSHSDKKVKHESSSSKKTPSKSSSSANSSPTKKGVKKEETVVWKWWEEEKRDDGVKWTTLQHSGPLFAPPYERVPSSVHFKYAGEKMRLSEPTEEVATFYARMLDHDYTSNPMFNKNFMHDWRKLMTPEEREKITDLSKCDFRQLAAYFKDESEKRKARSKEEKEVEKKKRQEEQDSYGTAILDGFEQKIANFRIEPPGLFRGRGGHPKMGKLKRRVVPEDVIINCGKEAKAPPPPPGHRWREVRHDNTVSWLASWTENVLNQNKYVMLNASSRMKGEKDWQKFETARKLHACVDEIRDRYREDFKSKEMRVRQRAVALYFIDKLALRAGNEKETDEAADTVGCCSLRVEHIKLHEQHNNKEFVVEFDFLGKDSIRYHNFVPVEKRVFKNLKLFMENKKEGDDLFDRLSTTVLNKHLQDQMEGLTAKVFRTYNASITLQTQLNKMTDANGSINDKILSYNRANRAVAILCNHQRAVPKTFEKSMENLANKIKDKKKEVKELKQELESCGKRGPNYEKVNKRYQQKKEQLKKLKIQQTDKDENKEIALGTSKLNYLDPRITVAWCKKNNVDVNKIYNKTQREKFQWAIDMADESFEF